MPVKLYKAMTRSVSINNNLNNQDTTEQLINIGIKSFEYLSSVKHKSLTSKVPNKEYFAFEKGSKISRAVNIELFCDDLQLIEKFSSVLISNKYESMTPEEITKACYTIAMSFCCVVDLEKVGDKKTPGTFFEYLIGNIFSRKIGINPRKQVEVPSLSAKRTKLPTDFVFDLGDNKPKFHLPIKTSTRERVIQVWAHQRVLEGVFGLGSFTGILVCLAETKLGKKNLDVIEICLPLQWKVYQLHIAKLKRIYYLDIPKTYESLNKHFSEPIVRPFGYFFSEVKSFCR